jgi:hypothetical protein
MLLDLKSNGFRIKGLTVYSRSNIYNFFTEILNNRLLRIFAMYTVYLYLNDKCKIVYISKIYIVKYSI